MDDIDTLVDLGRRFHAASPWSVLPFSPLKFKAQIVQMIEGDTATVIVNDTLTGMIGMISGQVYFSDDAMITQEAFWWCESPKDSLRLLLAAEEWSVNIGARWSCMVRLDGVTPGLEAYYLRRGYRPTEHYYLKALS